MPSNCLQQETGLQKSFHPMLLPPSQSVNQKKSSWGSGCDLVAVEQQQGWGWMPSAIFLIVETATEVKPQVLIVSQKRISEVLMKQSGSLVRTNFKNNFR